MILEWIKKKKEKIIASHSGGYVEHKGAVMGRMRAVAVDLGAQL